MSNNQKSNVSDVSAGCMRQWEFFTSWSFGTCQLLPNAPRAPRGHSGVWKEVGAKAFDLLSFGVLAFLFWSDIYEYYPQDNDQWTFYLVWEGEEKLPDLWVVEGGGAGLAEAACMGANWLCHLPSRLRISRLITCGGQWWWEWPFKLFYRKTQTEGSRLGGPLVGQVEPRFKILQPILVIARLTTHPSCQLATPNPRSTVLGEATTRVVCRHTQDVKKASCGHNRDEKKLAITSPISEKGRTMQ